MPPLLNGGPAEVDGKLTGLVRNTVAKGVGSVVVALLAIVPTPFLLRRLRPAECGVLHRWQGGIRAVPSGEAPPTDRAGFALLHKRERQSLCRLTERAPVASLQRRCRARFGRITRSDSPTKTESSGSWATWPTS